MPSRHQPKPFERINFYFGLLINIPLFIISFYSLLIARQTYIDSQTSGPAQQAALEGSRKALESVISISKSQKEAIDSTTSALKAMVNLTTRQQELLNAGLAISREQYKTIKQKNDDDRIKASYKPDYKIILTVNNQVYTAKNYINNKGNDWLVITLDSSFLNKKISSVMRLENKGKISAKGTLLLLTPLLPNTIDIEKISGQKPLYDHFNREVGVDVAEFYDYYTTEIAVSDNLLFIDSPEFKFNITPTDVDSAIKIDVSTTNGHHKLLVLYIKIR